MADKPIILITGGNTGIGYEAVKALYASPEAYTILVGSRSVDKGTYAISTLQEEVSNSQSELFLLKIDIESDESIENAFKEVESKWGRVDSLINNAGAIFESAIAQHPGPKGIREAWDHSYSLNVTSTEVFTWTFAPLLLKSLAPRLLFVTSGLASLTTCAEGIFQAFGVGDIPKGWPKPPAPSFVAYRSSKAALNMLMLEWTRTLKADGVKVFAISPGFLATGIGGLGPEVLKAYGASDPSLGGTFIKDVVEGKRDEFSGRVISTEGVQSW